jgi:hypothetical protein
MFVSLNPRAPLFAHPRLITASSNSPALETRFALFTRWPRSFPKQRPSTPVHPQVQRLLQIFVPLYVEIAFLVFWLLQPYIKKYILKPIIARVGAPLAPLPQYLDVGTAGAWLADRCTMSQRRAVQRRRAV